MTRRRPCPAAPGPLEGYAARFDDLFGSLPTRPWLVGPDGPRRLVVATADPAALPPEATWYLVTNLACPGGPRAADSPHPPAALAEIVRIYGIRNWIEQSYKQVKD